MTLSVSGLVSGIDVDSIVSQLSALQRRPVIQLQQQEAAYQVKLTAYANLQGALSSFNSAAGYLDSVSDLTGFSATSSDADVFTVSADNTASAGTYDISITQLAEAQKLKSVAFSETEEILTFAVDATNNKIDFKEDTGGGLSDELTAAITAGNYTASELETEIKTQLEAASDNGIKYTVSYDSSAQKFAVQEDGSSLTELQILWGTGANNATGASSLLGFDAADDTGAVSYTSDAAVGEGTIYLKVGAGDTVDISVVATDTIQDVADSINDADAGVQAAVIFDGISSYYLTLSAEDTGEANIINLTVTDIDGNNTDETGLSRLVYDEGVTERLTETQGAQDAIIAVDGVDGIHRETNSIDDLIDGVTITLLDAHADPLTESASLTVSRDTSSVVSKIDSFVSAYNSMLGLFDALQQYDEDSDTTGVLFGDSTTTNIRNRIRSIVSGDVSGIASFNRLSDFGIDANDDGELEVDYSTLNSAFNDNFDDAIEFFTRSTEGSEGFAVRMANALDMYIDPDSGMIAVKEDGIKKSIDSIHDQTERIEGRIAASEARTRSQFQALELILGQYQAIGDVLTQQLTAIANLNSQIAKR